MREDLHGHSPYGDLVGTKIVSADPTTGTIVVEYVARQDFTNRIGIVSGGMLSAMLDSVTGLAALVSLPNELVAVHTTLQIEYVRPARPGPLTGSAEVVEQSDREIRSRGELTAPDGTTIARGEATLRIRSKK